MRQRCYGGAKGALDEPHGGFPVPLVVVGGYVLHSALRPAYYLHVRSESDARKIVFAGRVDLPSLAVVLRNANERFGYVVAWTIPEPRKTTSTYR